MSIQKIFFLEKIMGNKLQINIEQPPNTPPSLKKTLSKSTKVPLKKNPSFVSSHFRSASLSQIKCIRLSQLRGKLTPHECFYALSTLIQQYYSLFKFYKKVVVSDNLCLVNQLGEINVDFCIDGPDTDLSFYNQVTHSYVTVISQIMTLVEKLASDQDNLKSAEIQLFMSQLIATIHNCHENNQLLYTHIIQLLNSFLEINNIKCNLIDAYLRYWKCATLDHQPFRQSQEETPYLANSRITQRYRTSVVEKIINESSDHQSELQLRRKQSTFTRESNKTNNRNCLPLNIKNQSKYSHKMVRTEGQGYYMQMLSKRNNENIHPSTLYEQSFNTRFAKNEGNRISHQYTLNIMNYKGQHEQKKIQKGVKKNRVRHQDTSLNKLAQIKFEEKSEAGKSCAKSMLQQLARSVSIRDQPNSRDYIN